MITAASITAIYTPLNMIKSVRQVQQESKILTTPRQSTIDVITDELKFCIHLSRESLLKRTRVSNHTLDNALRFLVLNQKVFKKFTGRSGPHDKFLYSLVRGNL